MLIKSRRTELNNALISSVKSNRMILQIAKRQRHFNKYDFNKTLVGRKCRGKRRIDKKLVHGSCLFKGTRKCLTRSVRVRAASETFD